MATEKSSSRSWMSDAAIYQIYPRSFKDSTGSGLGDIAGITQQMDYLERLGIEAIWLSPFYPSPLVDGGYDVADYCDVDPRLGSLDDFDDMIAAAHARGIKVIVAAAGKAAHLGGVVAAFTPLPVIGVPMKTSDLGGLDSLLSMVQMPSGVPVACVAINGAKNAAIYATQILGATMPEYRTAVEDLKREMAEA